MQRVLSLLVIRWFRRDMVQSSHSKKAFSMATAFQERSICRAASLLRSKIANVKGNSARIGAIACVTAIIALCQVWNTSASAGPSTSLNRTRAQHAKSLEAYVIEASHRFSIPESWIRAVMHVESGNQQRAHSFKGAMGLMQIMPETWTELRTRYGLGADPYDPRDNILAGAAYLREMHDRYGAAGFLAAYNAGPARYERHLGTGRPLPVETQVYVAMLAPMIEGRQVERKTAVVRDATAWQRSTLFIARERTSPTDDRPSPKQRSDRSSTLRPVINLSALMPQARNLFVRREAK